MDMLCFPARRADFCKAIDWRQAPRGECFLLCVQDFLDFFFKRKEPIQVIKNF